MGAPKGHCNTVKHGGYMRLSERKLDGRSKLAKALKHIKEQLVTDLGGDITKAQELLIDRIRFKAANLCFMELGMSEGEMELNDKYIALSNSFRMDLALLGLERKQKDYISLKDYVKEKEVTDG